MELGRVLAAHLEGRPVPETRNFDQREPPFQQMSDDERLAALHRWDLVGDDDHATAQLSQPWMTTHSVHAVGGVPDLRLQPGVIAPDDGLPPLVQASDHRLPGIQLGVKHLTIIDPTPDNFRPVPRPDNKIFSGQPPPAASEPIAGATARIVGAPQPQQNADDVFPAKSCPADHGTRGQAPSWVLPEEGPITD
jgi:hypothetical protein